MKPVILAHEYPPAVGGIGDHVSRLARALVEEKPDLRVHVIANDERRGCTLEGGVSVHRTSALIAGNNFLDWMLVLNPEFVREAASLVREPDAVLHAHDWMTVPAATTLRLAQEVPFVLTIHSTERRRCNGIHSEYSQAIESIEEQGVREAARIVVNDEETMEEVVSHFETARRKIEVIEPDRSNWAARMLQTYQMAREEVGLR